MKEIKAVVGANWWGTQFSIDDNELLTCYPEEWVQEVIQCCGLRRGGSKTWIKNP